jgi:hypothetical protein
MAGIESLVEKMAQEMNTLRPLPFLVRFFAGIALAWAVVAGVYLIVFLCKGAALSEVLPLPRWGEQGQ